jgi:hypothetical protein
MADWMALAPYAFAHAYMTRTGRVSEAQLQRIAPRFMARWRAAERPRDAAKPVRP